MRGQRAIHQFVHYLRVARRIQIIDRRLRPSGIRFRNGGYGNLHLEWLSPDGKSAPFETEPRVYWWAAFSPDGKYLAVVAEAGGSQDVWVYDSQRKVPTRLTFGGGNNFPAWMPDGKGITYAADDRNGTFSLWWKRADGDRDPQRLLRSRNRFGPMTRRPDGKALVFTQTSANGDLDLMWVTVDSNEKSRWKVGQPQAFLATPGFEDSPAFSPDGKWLAYQVMNLGRRRFTRSANEEAMR